MAPGTGKSRIIATTALAALLWTECTKVHLVFPNESLMMRDSEEFTEFWLLSSNEDKVQYHSSVEFEMKDKEIAIFDEAD